MESLISWIVAFMVAVAPPGRPTFVPEAQETKEAALARYQSIATDIVDVVYDPKTKPLFKGSEGRARTVSVILALMLHESAFMKNVDEGKGKFSRGDAGKSWCLLQLNVGKGRSWSWNAKHDRLPRRGDDPADIIPGFTGPEMVADRKKCIIAGLRGLRVSFSSCPGLPLDQKLRTYGSGSCKKGGKASSVRMHTSFRLWYRTKDQRTWKDSDIVGILKKRQEEDNPVFLRDLTVSVN